MKTRKCCWTCTARKIQCDGTLPTCMKCDRSQRKCEGYELRLSWPREGDNKRALKGIEAPAVTAIERSNPNVVNPFFVNATSHHMELYGYSALQSHGCHTTPSFPRLLRQPQVGVGSSSMDTDLFHHFQNFAYRSLVTFGQNTWKIRNALMSMALTKNSNSGLALRNALLSYASLHRHGLNEQALKLKIQAIRYLSTSVTSEALILGRAAQHVAASMVLGAFEIMQPLEGSGEWLLHTWGAVDMIHATRLQDEPHDSDVGQLLSWAYYHETQSRFALHHWRHKSFIPPKSVKQNAVLQNPQYPPLTRYRPPWQNIPPVNPTYAILNLLSEVCDTLIDPRDPRSQDESYQNQLKDLGGRVRDISVKPAIPSASDPEAAFAIELYQMATQIYLVRASQSPWEPPADLDALVEAAFAGPVQSCTCEHFFPLLILACEARCDEQRIGIINLIERTQRDIRIRSIQAVKNTIQSIWVQQDLHKDDDVLVDYLGTLSSAISSSNTVPSFA
ncbi:Zinc-finger transcription factor [Colletotrichum scovillei]|uniref:Zinc-finger transcription factor n=1 Tax=Colletotrichum scovillei TaxID=1209932 RepID=A0A9P7QTY1_9PEZI|nr:Zinc-finger transcription factor [Colletotrichum scovillei]KAG7041490.1 Zinc-finger transcription factor [Colletotrichum scovillei]